MSTDTPGNLPVGRLSRRRSRRAHIAPFTSAMTKPVHDRPTIPAPPSAHALNACRAHAAAVGLPSQIERKRRAAQKRLLARQAEIEARRDTVPAPPCDLEWSAE